MEEGKNQTNLLDSVSPSNILDALAGSIIDLLRPAAVAQLQAYCPSNQNLIVIHRPIGSHAGSGHLSLRSGVDSCQITVVPGDPTLPTPHPSRLPPLRRRCLCRGPVDIFVSPRSIEITRHESRRIPSDVPAGSGPSWIRSLLDSDPDSPPWNGGSPDVLPVIVGRLDAGMRGFEELFRLATECKGGSKVPQILGAIHTLKQMIRVLSPGVVVENPGGKGTDKRKRCSVELFVAESGCGSISSDRKSSPEDLPPSAAAGSNGVSMEEVVEEIGGARGVMEDPEEYSEVVNKMKRLCCSEKICCEL